MPDRPADSRCLPLPPWPPRWPEIEAAAEASIRSGDWGRYRSDAIRRLRASLSGHFCSPHVRLCCSGTAAIEWALRAADIGEDDEVILAAFDYPGNLRCVEIVGARPVLVDVAPGSVTLDPAGLAAAASERVRAVIVSHLFGQAADIEVIREECRQRGWLLIEDACQVPGMKIRGKPAGSFGDIAALSFGGSKPLTAGCGGALLTSDDRFAARLSRLLDRPSDAAPLSPLQASVLEPQLGHLERLNRLREQTVRRLVEEAETNFPSWRPRVRPPAKAPPRPTALGDATPPPDDVEPAYYKLAWETQSRSQRDRLVDRAGSRGLPIGAGFRAAAKLSPRRVRKPVPLHRSERLGVTTFLLDHTALLIEPDQLPTLFEALGDLHDHTR